MPRPAVILCCIVALAGPLLRQAEAADDLARSLAELACVSTCVASIDGGVGDDPGLTVKSSGQPGAVHVADLLTWADDLGRPSWVSGLAPALRHPRVGPPPSGLDPARRRAWLQAFLF